MTNNRRLLVLFSLRMRRNGYLGASGQKSDPAICSGDLDFLAQIPLGSTRLDSTRSTLSSQSSKSRRARRARRAVLFQHGGRRTILYKF